MDANPLKFWRSTKKTYFPIDPVSLVGFSELQTVDKVVEMSIQWDSNLALRWYQEFSRGRLVHKWDTSVKNGEKSWRMNSPGTDSNIPVRIIHATLKDIYNGFQIFCEEEQAVMQDTLFDECRAWLHLLVQGRQVR